MIYTSGIISDITRKESLEELQDNKLALVCHKLELKPTDTLLDIGCGWGTLSAYAAKNFGCDVTGITLGKNQTIFGNKRIEDNGVPAGKARILCQDYREIAPDKKYSKIVSLEMAEVRSIRFEGRRTELTLSQHVGIRNYTSFMTQVYNLLEDDGIFVLQVAGIRPTWQYEDLIWCVPLASAYCARKLIRLAKGSLHEQIRLPWSRRLVRPQLGHQPGRGCRIRGQVLRRPRCPLCVVLVLLPLYARADALFVQTRRLSGAGTRTGSPTRLPLSPSTARSGTASVLLCSPCAQECVLTLVPTLDVALLPRLGHHHFSVRLSVP